MWTQEQHRSLGELVADLEGATDAVVQQPKPAVDHRALADTATNLWRALRKLDSANGTLPTAGRHAHRYLRATRTDLATGGLVIHDHEGEAYHPGLSLDVLVRDDDESATEETIFETVRPTIVLHGERIQRGQVIVVGPPFRQSSKEETSA
ncbi:hypothetical protein GCM10009765_54230 [Fodinicola feengrottensis]|uniref:Uncharacterized protein n=1 Tax=Fodinicola feengrottensis TaxID=435914 RepID=A0ABN2I3B1_9ACTN